MENFLDPWSSLGIKMKLLDEWMEAAERVLAAPDNVCLIGDTGTGKTPTAFLVSLRRGVRTLFLAPTRVLALQQYRSYVEFIGDPAEAQLLSGSQSRHKRNWRPEPRMTVCTPHTFWADWTGEDRRVGDIRQFGLIILDECHRTSGKYPYTKIAEAAKQYGIPVLGLTASPGDNEGRIADLFERCFFDRYVLLEVDMPPKYEDRILVTMPLHLADCEAHLRKALGRGVSDMVTQSIKVSDLCPGMKELIRISREELPAYDFWDLASRKKWTAWAKTIILRYALSAVLLESYETFFQFGRELEAVIEGMTDRRMLETAKGQIYMSPDWQAAMTIANEYRSRHPKVRELLKLAQALAGQGKNGLVFVGNKSTARFLSGELRALGLRSDTLLGGDTGKNQADILARLAARELDFTVATSVVEEGVNIPAMDTVIHYSMPLLGIQRTQRSGRTGRNKPGVVIFLVLDHPFDRAAYWGIRKKELAMRELLGRRPQTFQRHAHRALPLFDKPSPE